MKYLLSILFLVLVHQIFGQGIQDNAKEKVFGVNSAYVETGYEYGLLPFLGDSTVPDGNFRAIGNIGIQLKSLPLNATFLYNSNNSNVGINNYFKISFDANLFKEQQLEKIKGIKKDAIDSLQRLSSVKDEMSEKLKYLELIQKDVIAFPLDSGFVNQKLSELPEFNWMDSVQSLKQNSNYTLSDLPIDSLNKMILNDYLDNYMSIIENDLNVIDSTSIQFNKIINMNADSLLRQKGMSQIPGTSKFNQIISLIDKFEFGLVYPDYSSFLTRQIPVKGVNFELSDQKYFVAFTHGTVQPNIFFSNDILSNNLNASKNVFNFFDFNNTEFGRKVTSFKLGVGSKKKSHIHVGLLHGLGELSYADTSSIGEEKNAVVELDLKLSHKWADLSVVYGRSQLQLASSSIQTKVFSELMTFKDRSNALIASVNSTIDKTGTSFEVVGRYIEPLFESFGVGFMKSDNLRAQVKLSQTLGRRGKISLFYRRENDNILNWYDFKNVISSWGVSGKYKPSKELRLSADFRPLGFNSEVADTLFGSNSYIMNAVLSFQKRKKKFFFTSNVIVSYYDFNQGLTKLNYLNIGNQTNMTYKGKFGCDLSYNYFETNDSTTIPRSHLMSAGLSFQTKKMKLGAEFNYTVNSSDNDYGYGLEVSVRLSRLISVSFTGRKVVAGNFYTQYYLENLKKVPYYCYARLLFSL